MSSNNNKESGIYDVIVVGAGPGGLAAGMYAARAKLKAIVLEKGLPGGQINNTGLIEDYPGFPTIDARELAQKMDESLAESAEKTAGLRKLLEAKDCFVRAKLEQSGS